MPGGVLLFVPLYHPLHDFYNIHSEVTFFLLLSISVSIIWLSLPINSGAIAKTTSRCIDLAMILYLSAYYMVFLGAIFHLLIERFICQFFINSIISAIAVFIDPASEISIGWHEKIGPCDEKTSMYTALGSIVYKRKYFCLTDNDETYFGWSCLPGGKPPKNGAHWYTICGTAWINKVEYIVILSAIAILGISFFAKVFSSEGWVNDKSKGERKSVVNKQKLKSN